MEMAYNEYINEYYAKIGMLVSHRTQYTASYLLKYNNEVHKILGTKEGHLK